MISDKRLKPVRWVLISLYILFIFTRTVLGRSQIPEQIFKGLFWEIEVGYWSDIILNIVLFMPLGFLIGGCKGLIIGFGLSCGIELLQFVGKLGFCEVDDVLNNTIGTGVGVLLNMRTKSIIEKVRANKEDHNV